MVYQHVHDLNGDFLRDPKGLLQLLEFGDEAHVTVSCDTQNSLSLCSLTFAISVDDFNVDHDLDLLIKKCRIDVFGDTLTISGDFEVLSFDEINEKLIILSERVK